MSACGARSVNPVTTGPVYPQYEFPAVPDALADAGGRGRHPAQGSVGSAAGGQRARGQSPVQHRASPRAGFLSLCDRPRLHRAGAERIQGGDRGVRQGPRRRARLHPGAARPRRGARSHQSDRGGRGRARRRAARRSVARRVEDARRCAAVQEHRGAGGAGASRAAGRTPRRSAHGLRTGAAGLAGERVPASRACVDGASGADSSIAPPSTRRRRARSTIATRPRTC